MQNRDIDLGSDRLSRLFRIYFIPTLIGMLSLCVVTATDGIFIGHGVGSDGLAAVNICVAPTMLIMGIGLMLGVGASVVSSIHLARDNEHAARLNVTRSLACGTLAAVLFLALTLACPSATGRILGSSDTLLPLVTDYMPWIFACTLPQIWCAIGLFIVRLDGAPRYAMWCNVLPGLLNVVLDYIFIFPLGMGLTGAGIATLISIAAGGIMTMSYLCFFARRLRPVHIDISRRSLRLSLRNIAYQCRLGVSALLGEATMGMLMLTGNIVFMHYLGNDGVGAFSIACYYCPLVFMVGNAIAQSAQPIISYNYGLADRERVAQTERIAIIVALACGTVVTAAFMLFPAAMVKLFIDGGASAAIATAGFPYFAFAFIPFIFNLTVIGYYQSVERVAPSIVFALLRGVLLLVPSFMLMPLAGGTEGIWLALGVSEWLTAASIVLFYFCRR